jgi:beta-aspartyl-dipeptidase (metallo-type)
MLTLLKDIECYSPQYLGKKDILIASDKIVKIHETNQRLDCGYISNIIECDGQLAFPGIIDQHVHIVGGGGEGGFVSRIPEIEFNEIINSGVTTLVGLLGVDSYTKSLNSLLAKSRALEQQGITTYLYSGSYTVPTTTLTLNIISDIVLIDKVIGTGEIAISDHRSSQPSIQDLIKIASETHIGGLVSGKAGIVHIHVGNGKSGLNLLLELLAQTDYPIEEFVPTHMNRNSKLQLNTAKMVETLT